MKGVISSDHIPVNKYQLLFLGMPPLTITEISGIEQELQTTDLPDKTVASGGDVLPVEFSIKIPLHETVQVAACELWLSLSKGDVDPNYKLMGTLIMQSITGNLLRTYALVNAFPFKRGLPDLSMENEGDAAIVEFGFKADDVFFVS
jgi:hypothetical protein